MSELAKDLIELYNQPASNLMGDVGEVVTASTLRDLLGFQVVRNIYLPDDCKFVEIDMIAISSDGIYIIENKNYKGKVRGSSSSYFWNVSYGYGNFEKLYNPIMQNKKHVDAISKLLSDTYYKCVPLTNLVIFNDFCVLKLSNCSSTVFRLTDFVKFYTTKGKSEILSGSDIQELYNIFSVFSDSSEDMKLIHTFLLGDYYESDRDKKE